MGFSVPRNYSLLHKIIMNLLRTHEIDIQTSWNSCQSHWIEIRETDFQRKVILVIERLYIQLGQGSPITSQALSSRTLGANTIKGGTLRIGVERSNRQERESPSLDHNYIERYIGKTKISYFMIIQQLIVQNKASILKKKRLIMT